MEGRSRFEMPSVKTLSNHYNADLLIKKKALRERIANDESQLEGRMTVEDYRHRQTLKS